MDNIKKNYLYNSAYQILAMVIPLITTPYVSRALGTNGIGRYSYAYSIAYYFMMFAMLGLNNYGNRTIAAVRDDDRKCAKTFSEIYIMQLFCAVIMVILYGVYVLFVCEDRALGLIMLIFVFSSALDINWFFFGLEQFKLTVIRNTTIKLLTVAAIFVFVKNETDVYAYSAIYAVGTLVSQLYLWTQISRFTQFIRVKVRDVIAHFKPNLVLFIPLIAVSLYKYMDKIMLGALTNDNEVGIYESCEKVINIPLGLIVSLGTVMLPRISNLLVNEGQEKAKQFFSDSIRFAMFLATSMSFGIMAVAKEFVPVFYGKGFDACIGVFQVLLPSCLFVAFANVIRTQYLIPQKKDSVYIVSVFIGAAINLIANACFIPGYKALGAAMGTVCAEAAVCIAQSIAVRNDVGILRQIKNSCPFVISGIVMYVVLYYCLDFGEGILALCLKIVAGVALYSACMIPFIAKDKELRSTAMSLLRRQKNES